MSPTSYHCSTPPGHARATAGIGQTVQNGPHMTDAAFGLHQIGQIRIQVTDVDRAVAFYRDQLGMDFLYAFPGMGFFDAGGGRLMLVGPEGGGRGWGRRSRAGPTPAARRRVGSGRGAWPSTPSRTWSIGILRTTSGWRSCAT